MSEREPRDISILHCFADYGTESEILSNYGDVVRIGIDAKDTNESQPISADAHVKTTDRHLPISDDVTFELGVFHPVCSRWAATTSISGDPDSHENMIPSARAIAEEYCDEYVIENVPRAPLNDPVVLDGSMFGLPIRYERAFETSFRIPEPPREGSLLTNDGPSDTVETSTFFFSERSKEWWAATKQYDPRPYIKDHLAKNTIPGPYIHYILRAWLAAYEEKEGISEGRVDYSDYDDQMEKKRRSKDNRQLDEY